MQAVAVELDEPVQLVVWVELAAAALVAWV
jgi:hypothetical protein